MGEPATAPAPMEVQTTPPFDESTEPIIIQEITLPTSPPPQPPPPPPPTDATMTEASVKQCRQDHRPKRKRGRPRKVAVASAETGNEPPVKRQKREIAPLSAQPVPQDAHDDQPTSLQARRGVVTLPKIVIPHSTTQSPFPLTVKLVIMR